MHGRPRQRRGGRGRGRAVRAIALALAGLALACDRAPAPRHLVLVSVDTLRADHLGAYGADLPLTPHLDALARTSVVFTRAYAPAPFTLPSVATLLTGRLPAEVGVDTNLSRLAPGPPTLAVRLRAAGWHTAAVVSNFVLRRRSGVDRGFDHFDDTFGPADARGTRERTAVATTDAALAAVDAWRAAPGEGRAARLFLWVHYQDPHGPYTPPAGLRERFLAAELARRGGARELPFTGDHRGRGGIPDYQRLGDERRVGWYRAGYAGEVHHADAEIGRLLRGLADRGLLPDAALLVTADHGESLGEDDQWFAHGERLSEPLVRVPLLLRAAGLGAARRADLAGLVDVVPTLAALAGLEADGALRGRDLLAARDDARAPLYLSARGHASLPRFGLVTDAHKLVVEGRGARRGVRLTALGADAPDLAAREPDTVAQLAERLFALRRALPSPRGDVPALDAEERRALRALGYATP